MKRTYISSLVDVIPAKRKIQSSRRNDTLVYSLKKGTEKMRVCKRMFLSTLGVGEWTDMSMQNRKRCSTKGQKEAMKMFLNDLPKMPSHYCRSSTARLYLEPVFQSKMDVYREYEKYCGTKSQKPFSEKIFFKTLEKENIKLYRPRKDQCDTCIAHTLGNIDDKTINLHQRRKDLARSSKENDKKLCIESNGKILVITVDVQGVMLCPMLKASAIYYKTKLTVHNYTIYNLFNKDVMCYLWDESQGGLEASNFATMLTDYLTRYITEVPGTEEVIIYSDGCGYQNKNCVLSNALLKFSADKKIPIFQKFFEKGRSQMEVDSVHSTIERKLKNRNIYLPTDYIAVCREARLKHPYQVKYMSYDEFMDFTKIRYYSSIRPGYKAGDPKVTDIHCLMYLPSSEIKYKIDYTDEWSEFSKKPKLGCYEITRSYKTQPKIKAEKYNHLQVLKAVIDKQFWSFYDSLSH
nr:unnamed protein product [Callosobruchus chinensis]CAH7717262.1 unnamed protein product [Callosobruchus chinensis]